MKSTPAARRIAAAMLSFDSVGGRIWGYELSRAARVRSATVYLSLTRMLDAGWLTDGWEDPAATDGRPPRRYYQLTERGRVCLARRVEDSDYEEIAS